MNYSPTIAQAPGPFVLTLHCIGGTPRQWEPLGAALEDMAALHAPSLPLPDTARLTLAAQAAPLLDWLDRAPAPVHLVGHSHGGALALLAAVEAGTRALQFRRSET